MNYHQLLVIVFISSSLLLPFCHSWSWFDNNDEDEDYEVIDDLSINLDPDYHDEYPPPQSTYHGYCDNEAIKCDPTTFMTCRQEKCDCLNPKSMTHDGQRCVVQLGERCKFQSRNKMTLLPCIQNSACNSRGVCICGSSFYENSQGFCSPLKSHGQNCTSTTECSKDLHLHCQYSSNKGQGTNDLENLNHKTCACEQGKAVWSAASVTTPKNRRGGGGAAGAAHLEPHCVGLAGHPCVDYHCVENAICTRAGSQGPRLCKCVQGHHQNEEGQCVKNVRIFGKCTSDSTCEKKWGTQLTCVNGTCGCDPSISTFSSKVRVTEFGGQEDQQVDDEDDGDFGGQCMGVLDAPCVTGHCVAGAFCDLQKNLCQCPPGLVKSNKSGKCVRGFGTPCKFLDDDGVCAEGLVCKEEKCDCRYGDEKFDSKSEKCVSTVDGRCHDDSDCVAHAQCLNFQGQSIQSNNNSIEGFCNCVEGRVENSEGECDLEFGQICGMEKSQKCAVSAGLTCVNSICVCQRKNFVYNKKWGKCLALWGSKCRENEDCVENAQCDQHQVVVAQGKEKIVKFRCACVPGFSSTVNGTCAQFGNEVVVDYPVLLTKSQKM